MKICFGCSISAVTFFLINIVFGSDFDEVTTSFSDSQLGRTNDSACDAVFTEKIFVLKSPNYPENYPSDSECNYQLNGPQCSSYYELEFLDFDVEDSTDCAKDRLEVGDQDKLCGKRNNVKRYFAQNGYLNITFKTDGLNSGKGFRILVTRMLCLTDNAGVDDVTTEFLTEVATESATEFTTQLIESRNFPYFQQEESECCSGIYDSKRFIITSPNFPYSINKKTECIYKIRKANNNVCRLRLNFLFFWLGFTNFHNYCPYGFLEIDGKYICGCNKAVQLTATFGSSDIKTIKFKTDGFYQKSYTGFVVEVTQDECPKKYSPEYSHKINSNCSTGLDNYYDDINRVSWQGDLPQGFLQKLQLINQRTEILDDDTFLENAPKVVKSVYFFAAPEFNEIPSQFTEREKTTHIDINNIDSILTNNNYFECSNWNKVQYNLLEQSYGESLRICNKEEGSEANTEVTRDCIELGYVNGYFKSPGYPYYYPGNLNICYRFRKQPGYCKMRMLMNDFQVEDSVGCNKDYLLLANGDKYCGNRLYKASWTIDLRNRDHEDMRFVTDDYYCGRGFSGVYQQVECQDMTLPINPTNPSIPPVITTPNHVRCDKHIKDKLFSIEVNSDSRLCTFTIRKATQDVCKINFVFENFDLICGLESLIIDGTSYCGNLSGKIVTVNLHHTPKTILYRSDDLTENSYGTVKLKIEGEQVSDDCLFPEVPAQRLLSLNSTLPQTKGTPHRFSENYLNPQNNSKYLVALLNKQFKDICGIVTNTTEKELPPTFCEILMNEHNATKCIPLKDTTVSSDVPYTIRNTTGPKIIQDVKIIQNVEFSEIDCDEL